MLSDRPRLLTYSLGLRLESDGTVEDSIFFMPAAQAGIVPGMRIVAVNGRKFTENVLHNVIAAAQGTSQNLELLVENADYFKTYTLNYHAGEKYPHLERDNSKPDLLSDIMRAHRRSKAVVSEPWSVGFQAATIAPTPVRRTALVS